MRRQTYGLKGFLYHQFIEYLEVMPVTASFIAWIMRRKVPFKVTPKGSISGSARILVFNFVFLLLICISIVLGINWIFSSPPIIKEAVVVNIVWTIYHAFFMIGGTYIALNSEKFERAPYTRSNRAPTDVMRQLLAYPFIISLV
jgi:cellulose synthase (UDP-forming)